MYIKIEKMEEVIVIFCIFMFTYIWNLWYFTRKYNNKIEDLLCKIEDLIIEKHRARKDIVSLLATLSEQKIEISYKDEKISELENRIYSIQTGVRKRARAETD